MLAASPRGFRRKMGDAVRLIDSTGLHLAGVGSAMGAFLDRCLRRQGPCHLRSRLSGRPVYHAVSAANVNDITAAKAMPIDPGATYVFDLGYYDLRLVGAGSTPRAAGSGDPFQDQYAAA